jgi:hypothetical protein
MMVASAALRPSLRRRAISSKMSIALIVRLCSAVEESQSKQKRAGRSLDPAEE